MTTSVEDYLGAFLARNGEEAWKSEVQRLAVAALRTGSAAHEQFWRDLTKDYAWLDWDQLIKQAQPTAPGADRLIAEAFKSQMPGIRSQAQYDAAVGALEAARLVIISLLSPNPIREQEARKALEWAFDAVAKATDATLRLEDSPEAAMSAAAQQFKDAPLQFQETEIHAQLMQELLMISSAGTLQDWYQASKGRRDKIVSQSLRNDLLDAIRAKRTALVG